MTLVLLRISVSWYRKLVDETDPFVEPADTTEFNKRVNLVIISVLTGLCIDAALFYFLTTLFME